MKIKIISTTTDSNKVAKEIAKLLIKEKFSPCVQIIPKVQSFYNWKGELEETVEFLLTIKTTFEKINNCMKLILKHHNYAIPEIVMLDAEILHSEYKEWFNQNLR